MKIDTTLTVGNMLTILGMTGAIIIFTVSLNVVSSSNREDILELKQAVKEVQLSIRELQTTVNAIDKKTAVLEERTNRTSASLNF
jgi:peptidoglycan hydrolase CwlO-like protein